MPRTTARRLSSALVFATLLSLPIPPATAAAAATPKSSESRSVDRLWSWLTELWGGAGRTAVERPAAGRRRPSILTGKLGGFLDPDGATKLAPTSGTTIN